MREPTLPRRHGPAPAVPPPPTDPAAAQAASAPPREPEDERLRDTAERRRLLVDGARDLATLLLDVDGRVTYWSPGAENVFGWTGAEAREQPGETIFTPEDRAAKVPEREMAEARESGRAGDTRWHLRKDGSRFFAEGVMVALRDPAGRQLGYGKVLRDATERKQAQDERARALREAQYVTAHARCLLWVGSVVVRLPEDAPPSPGRAEWDTDVADPEAAHAFFPLELLPGERYTQAWYRHRPDEDKRATDAAFWAAIGAGGPDYSAEFRCRSAAGALHWFSERVHAEPIGPQAWRLVGVAVDVTERKRAEEEARQAALAQRAFLRDVLSSVTEGRLRLVDGPGELPAPLAPVGGPVALERESLGALRALAVGAARGLGFDDERTHDLVTAVGEASMNAAVHAKEGVGEVGADPASGTVQVRVTDTGGGIALAHLPRATLERGYSAGETKGFGFGFWIMLQTADRVWLLTGTTGTSVVLEMDRVPPKPGWLGAGPSPGETPSPGMITSPGAGTTNAPP